MGDVRQINGEVLRDTVQVPKEVLWKTAIAELDAKDGKDGKISGSVWNEYAEKIGAETISEESTISVEEAFNELMNLFIRKEKSDKVTQESGQTTAPPKKDENPPRRANFADLNNALPTKTLTDIEQSQDLNLRNLGVKDSASGNSYVYDGEGYVAHVYDNNGNKTRSITHKHDGTVFFYDDYEYDKNGRVSREIFRNADGTVDKYWDYEYDKNGNETRLIIRNADGTVNNYSDFEYDKNGKKTRLITYSADETVNNYKDFEYDKNGNETRVITYNADGTVNNYEDREYDKNGKITRVITYNADGKEVSVKKMRRKAPMRDPGMKVHMIGIDLETKVPITGEVGEVIEGGTT